MVSTLSSSLAIIYFVFGLIVSVCIVEALPISSAGDGVAVLRTRTPKPRIIPDPNASLSDILSDLGLHINVNALKNAVESDIADKLGKPKNRYGSSNGTGASQSTATPTASNSTASATPTAANMPDLVQDLTNTLKSALTSVLYDSDEHGLS
ncbi:hypothetical protein DTO271G3_4536 [Paecilomyces variotii]|nr:hypothetical protein DTO271G3_4536 [Paecilomyces variotii]